VDIYQIAETLPGEVIAKMHGAPKADHPIITADKLTEYDGYLFGIPTRYGRAVGQVSNFFDQTGQLWMKGALTGKFGGVFTSTGTQHGGIETTALSTIPFFTHHGIIYVPLGYADKSIMDMSAILGASPWGAGTHAGADGSRQPTAAELATAAFQGKAFTTVVATYIRGKMASTEAPIAAKAVPSSAVPEVDAPAPSDGYNVENGTSTTKGHPIQTKTNLSNFFARCCGSADKSFS